MNSDVVRWTRKCGKYSSSTITRKRKQIFDDDSPFQTALLVKQPSVISTSTVITVATGTTASPITSSIAPIKVVTEQNLDTTRTPSSSIQTNSNDILVNLLNLFDTNTTTTTVTTASASTSTVLSLSSSSSISSFMTIENTALNTVNNNNNNNNNNYTNIIERNRSRLINTPNDLSTLIEGSYKINTNSCSHNNVNNTSTSSCSYSSCSNSGQCKFYNKTTDSNNNKNKLTSIKNVHEFFLVIMMSTLIRFCSKLRGFFSILPYIAVILQMNFIFSDIIVNVVATSMDNNLYDINNSNNDNNNNNNNENVNFNNTINYLMNDVNSINFEYEEGFDRDKIDGHYTSTWAVHIPNGDNGLADDVARQHGFINLGKIFDDHYHFQHQKISKRSITPSDHHQKSLNNDRRVRWSKQQRAKSRQKRDFIRMRPSRTSSRTMSLVDSIQLSDPKWPQMWYLNRGGGLDMNVIPAWKEGITGKGVVVTILDDGLEFDHPDLEHNYDPKASYDVNSHDEDPMPHYDMTDSNRHGTRCAGEVAATANNSLCAVGIAFGARVGGVRMLDGDVTDAVEARSLSLNPQHIDIYSASWGPDDDGKTVDGPGELASRAFIEGVTKGRNGKGSIFIWASGNGGRELDNCNCDGYTNSIWTLSISSATEDGHVPWYSEKCSSTLATTYSSGGQSEKQVVTTDLHHSCTISHTGTSASAPLAAGIVALVLEANRNLTWRDLQHIVVRTAKPGNLKDPSWSKNGVGRRVSHSFGYGLMDASAMVKVARTWKTVPEQQRCEINAPHVDKVIPAKSYITLQLTVRHCMGVNFLEHVQAKITLTSQRRGDIQIYLKSPAGTKVTLLTSRMHDVSRSGFNQWPFMSVHTWGEAPHGNWQLEIHNEGRYMAQITQWDLIFYGTEKTAQPDDPIRISPGQYGGAYGSELEHNHLDFDSQTASGQWRNMQQVGESHVDVQRTTSNDQTSSACLNYSPDQRCIECHQTTFLYDGHCYKICPNRTYMLPEVPAYYPSKTYLLEPLMMTSNDQVNSFYDNDGTVTQNDHANNNKYNYYNIFETHKRAIMRPKPQKLCSSCDPSCFKCDGPNAGDCTECPAGYQLRKLASSDTFCYYLAERSSGNSGQGNGIHFNKKYNGAKSNTFRNYDGKNDDDDDDNNDDNDASIRNDLTMFFIIIIPAISMIFIVVALTLFGRKCKSFSFKRSGNDAYSYDRVAFEIEDDDDDDINVEINKKHLNVDNSCVIESQDVVINQQIPSTSKQYHSEKQEIVKTLLGNSDDSDNDYGNY